LSGTTRVSQYQKGKTNLDFSEARDSEWQWHRLDHMQVCTSQRKEKMPGKKPSIDLKTTAESLFAILSAFPLLLLG